MILKKLAIVWFSAAGAALAYDVSVTNQAIVGDPSLPILDNTLTPLTEGSVRLGYFESDGDITNNVMDFTALLAEFQQYGSDAEFVPGFGDGLFNLDTPSEFNESVPSGTTGDQVGQSIYVVFSNDLAGEDLQLAIFKSDSFFGTEDDAGNGSVLANISTGRGELLLGEDGGAVSYGNGAINYSNSIALVTSIPEPSSSLLVGLAGLTLAVRRRR